MTLDDDTTATTAETSAEETDDSVTPQDGGTRARALSATSFDITACVEFPKNVSQSSSLSTSLVLLLVAVGGCC